MLDLTLQVRLKQARNALRDGRLDEAFAIASEKAVREHRGGQLLLDDLVKPLLERAERHLAEDRLDAARLDAERAVSAGGNRPEALELRRKVDEALHAQAAGRRKEVDLVESARRHIQAGSLQAGRDLLQGAPPEHSEAARLQREAENRLRRAERAATRARELLERGDLVEALQEAEELRGADRTHPALPDLLSQLKKTCAARADECFDTGSLALCEELTRRLQSVAGSSLEVRILAEKLSLAAEAQEALQGTSHETARALLTRLVKMAPGAHWVAESSAAIARLDEALAALKAGPLGRAWRHGHQQAAAGVSKNVTVPHPGPVQPSPQPAASASRRLLLWVDGVGTYLLLTSSRVTVGRAGSSAHPDIALAADIAGHQAEFLRLDDDYFVVAPNGRVTVDGRPAGRKLLCDGQTIDIASRCRLSFHVPTPVSSTAVLSLHKGLRIHGDVRKVILLKDHMILAPGGKSHVETARTAPRIVISVEPRGLVCRAPEDIAVGSEPRGREAIVPLGAAVQVGEVTFTITDATGGRG